MNIALHVVCCEIRFGFCIDACCKSARLTDYEEVVPGARAETHIHTYKTNLQLPLGLTL